MTRAEKKKPAVGDVFWLTGMGTDPPRIVIVLELWKHYTMESKLSWVLYGLEKELVANDQLVECKAL